jgi:hypothetical protein
MVHLQLVEKLLIAAVADADVTVRQSIFSSLHGNRGFDDFLAQADILSAVFAALNDEVCMWLLELFHVMEDFILVMHVIVTGEFVNCLSVMESIFDLKLAPDFL